MSPTCTTGHSTNGWAADDSPHEPQIGRHPSPAPQFHLRITVNEPFFSRLLVLGDILGRDARWVARRRKALLDRRLLRLVTDKEVHWSGRGRGDLLELTPAGIRTLAAHLGLSLVSAVSQHGLAGGGPESPISRRRTLRAHLDHKRQRRAHDPLVQGIAFGHVLGILAGATTDRVRQHVTSCQRGM